LDETSGGGDDDDDDDDGVEDDGKRREQHEHKHIIIIGIYREILRTRTVLCSTVTESGTRLRFRVSVVHGHRLSVVGESVGAISTSGESRRALSRAREY
jgi:ribosomal protein S5